jgi:hypothetical protein
MGPMLCRCLALKQLSVNSRRPGRALRMQGADGPPEQSDWLGGRALGLHPRCQRFEARVSDRRLSSGVPTRRRYPAIPEYPFLGP